MSSRSHPLNSTDTTKMEKIMSDLMKNNDELPEGWEWKRLGEIAEVVAGNPAPQGEEYFRDCRYPFLRVQDMGRLGNYSYIYKTHDYINDKAVQSLRLFPKGSVLFTKSGASTLLNQRAILGRDMFVVSHISATIPHDGIMSEWLYYWLKTVDFNKLAHATTLPSLPLSKAKDIYIPIAPPVEQKLIVSEIEKQFSRLDEAVAALKSARASLKSYKASVLKAAVEGKLTEEKVKWNATTFGEIISISSGDGLTKTQRNDEGKYLVYGGNGITGRHSEFMYEEEKLIIGRVGVHCGNVHITKPKSWITDNAFVVSFDKENIDIKFLFHLICFLDLNKYSSSTAQPVISQGKLYPIEISIPENKEEQQRIVEEIESRLSVAEEIEETIDINLKRAERLRQAILKKAFSGRLI